MDSQEPPPQAPTQKHVVLRSVAFGAGFAMMLVIVVVAWTLYNRRPRPPKAWDTTAINAHYVAAQFSADEKENKLNVKLVFDLQNSTGSDYTLEENPSENTFVMQKVKSSSTLVNGMGLTWSPEHGPGTRQLNFSDLPKGAFVEVPVLIPAGQAIRMDFWSEYDIFDMVAASGNSGKFLLSNKNEQRKVFKEVLKDTDGFVLFDKINHYRIDLPLQDALR